MKTIYKICLLTLITVCNLQQIAIAEEINYRIVVRPKSRITNIPISFVCSKANIEDFKAKKLSILNDPKQNIKFHNNRKIKKENIIGNFKVKSRGFTYLAKIKSNKSDCFFKIHSSDNIKGFNYALSNIEQYEGMIVYANQNWIIINESEKKLIENSFNGNNLESGILQIFNDTKEIKQKFRFDCGYRPYIPGTRWSSGQVYWDIRDPRRAGFSIKDENDSSGYARALRCPKGSRQTEYRVDGVYKRRLPFTPLKVPDHCTATVKRSGKYSHSWYCCCNAALVPLKGSCKYINSLELPDWADSGRRC